MGRERDHDQPDPEEPVVSLLCALFVGIPHDAHAAPPLGAAATSAVIVNGRPAALPGVPPGRYWYDARSGLWGYVGGPSEGFFTPGLALGPLAANASGGGTGVVLNGRVLPPADLQYLVSLFGSVSPGRYWLDASGNIGREGGPAEVNLHAAIAASESGGGQQGRPSGATGNPSSDSWDSHVPSYDIDIGGGEFETVSGTIYSE